MTVGNNIKYLRLQKNIMQAQLAEQLCVSYQAISKWETGANTPDISLLPQISKFFGVSIDTLFSENIEDASGIYEQMQDDDVIRIVQMRGKEILKVSRVFSVDNPPIEIAFPRNCNDHTQYFKVEVFGHVITDSSINGDVICHQSIQCSQINGDKIHSDGDIHAYAINCSGSITCNAIHKKS